MSFMMWWWMSLSCVIPSFAGEGVRERLQRKLHARRSFESEAFKQAGEALEQFAATLKNGDPDAILSGLKELKIALTEPVPSEGLRQHRYFLAVVEAFVEMGQGRWRQVRALLRELPDDGRMFHTKLLIEGVLKLKLETPAQLKARWMRLQNWDVTYPISDKVQLSLLGTIPETVLLLIGKNLLEAGHTELARKWFSHLTPAHLRAWAWSLEPTWLPLLEILGPFYTRDKHQGTIADQLDWLALMIEVECAHGLVNELEERSWTLIHLLPAVGADEEARVNVCVQALTLESYAVGDLSLVGPLHQALARRFPEKVLPRLELAWLERIGGPVDPWTEAFDAKQIRPFESLRVTELLFQLDAWDFVIKMHEESEASKLEIENLEYLVFSHLHRKTSRDDVRALELSKYLMPEEVRTLVVAEVAYRQGHQLRAVHLLKQLSKTHSEVQSAAKERLAEIEGKDVKPLEEKCLPEPAPFFSVPLPRVESLDEVLPKRSRYLSTVESILRPLVGDGSFEHMKVRRKDIVALVKHLGGATSFGKGGHLKVSISEKGPKACVLSDTVLPPYQIKQLALALVEAGVVPQGLKNAMELRKNTFGGAMIKANDTIMVDDAGALDRTVSPGCAD